MRFRYVASATSGDQVIGSLEADSENAAEQMLWQRGYTIVDLKKLRKEFSLRESLPSIFGVKRRDLIGFSRDLGSLLKAGIAIIPALRMLHQQTKNVIFRKIIADIMHSVETGSSLSQACDKHATVFPSLYLRLLQIGEEIGNLELLLRQLAIHMEREETLRGKIKNALTYPSFLMLVASGTVFVLINFVLPALHNLLREFGGNLPLSTRMVLAFTTWSTSYSKFVLLGLGAAILFLIWYVRTSGGSRWKDKVLLRMPVIGSVVHNGALTGMIRNIKLLLTAGVPLTDALDMVINTTSNAVVKENLVQVRKDVHGGRLISQAMSARPIFPPLLTQMIAVGEQTGSLETNLDTLENIYDEDTERQIKRLLALTEPALILVVGGMVGFVAVSVISPIYGLINQIK